MKRLLILSIFPAPYRVDVFKELQQKYEITVYFEVLKNESRASEWFVQNSDLEFTLLTTPEGRRKYRSDYVNIKEYNAVLAYDYSSSRALMLQMQCILNRIPYYINCDGGFINYNYFKMKIKKYFVSHAKRCFAGNIHAKNYFLAYGAKEDNIVIHNFSSVHRNEILKTPPEPSLKELLRKKYNIQGDKIAISVGQFIYRKGYDILLTIWKSMPYNYHLIIIGGGQLQPEYEKIVSDNNMLNVHIYGYMQRSIIYDYYKLSDLFVFPTREDIWGLVINEAMACALPVITTDRCIAGLELIKNGINGYVVPVGDSGTLSERIIYTLNNDNLLKLMAKNCLDTSRHYTIEDIGESHMSVLCKDLAQ
jgi:glycosyltransferase involved in cell wall biosynthesis